MSAIFPLRQCAVWAQLTPSILDPFYNGCCFCCLQATSLVLNTAPSPPERNQFPFFRKRKVTVRYDAVAALSLSVGAGCGITLGVVPVLSVSPNGGRRNHHALAMPGCNTHQFEAVHGRLHLSCSAGVVLLVSDSTHALCPPLPELRSRSLWSPVVILVLPTLASILCQWLCQSSSNSSIQRQVSSVSSAICRHLFHRKKRWRQKRHVLHRTTPKLDPFLRPLRLLLVPDSFSPFFPFPSLPAR